MNILPVRLKKIAFRPLPRDFCRERDLIRGLPPLPPVIRYLDEYDDTWRTIRDPAADRWELRADTVSIPINFYEIGDCDAGLLARHVFFTCLSDLSPKTVAGIWQGFRQVNRRGYPWLLEMLHRPVAAWNEHWETEILPRVSEAAAYALKSILYSFCAMSLGDWHPGHRDFVRSLRWPRRKLRKGASVLDGSSIPSTHEESLIIEHLDTISRQVKTGETVPRDSLLSHCLLCICYEHALRPVQIGRIDLANLRTYEGDSGETVVHFTAFRAKKRDSNDKVAFVRKIKREWAAPFAEWQRLRMAEVNAVGRSPTASDKAFPLRIDEIITRIADAVELVTGKRRTATDLRHGAAQRLVDAGASVEEVAHFLGHSHWATSLVYFEASAAQGPNINKALAASPIYSRIVDVARNGYIDRAGLETTNGDQQIGAVPHGIPVSGIGACNLGQSLCTLNPAMSCYTCRRFIPIDEADVHRQVLSDFRGVVRFFYDEARGDRQSPAYMQLRTTLDAVQRVITELGDPGAGNP